MQSRVQGDNETELCEREHARGGEQMLCVYVRVHKCVCVCVCVCARTCVCTIACKEERERDRARVGKGERERERGVKSGEGRHWRKWRGLNE